MIEQTGAIDVYFEEEIEILVDDPDGYSYEKLESVLDSLEIEYTQIAASPRT